MTQALLKKLWAVWGRPGWESEWDGRVFGGGRLSQRFWEYLWVIKRADFDPDSVVLDIGSGFTLFFPRLLAEFVAEVVVYDPESPPEADGNITVVQELFGPGRVLDRPYTHICCVSVMEHVPDEDKPGLIRAMDAVPAPVFMTLELGTHRFKEQFLTMPLLSRMAAEFKNHYCSDMEACPVFSEDSYPPRIQLADGPMANLTSLWRPFGCVFRPLAGAGA